MRFMQRPSKTMVIGLVVGLAAAAGTVIGVSLAAPTQKPPPATPGEVRPGTPNTPDAATSEALTLARVGTGLDVGRMHILPPGVDAGQAFYNHPDQANGEVMFPARPASSPDIAKLGLPLHRFNPGAPFEVLSSDVITIHSPAGNERLFSEVVVLTSKDYRPLFLETYAIRPGVQVNFSVSIGDSERQASTEMIGTTPVILFYSPPGAKLQPVVYARFVIDDIYFVTSPIPMPVAVFTSLLTSIIEANR